MSTSSSLRQKQIESLQCMFNFNSSKSNQNNNDDHWKILIYDQHGQNIISPTMNVKQIQKHGITLHLGLHTKRDLIEDVPAIYFINPTEENIKRVIQDLSSHLYESYYLNFIAPISRHRLEDLAQGAISMSAVPSISKVVDQYLNFICLEEDMFVLSNKDSQASSFYAMNRSTATAADIEAILDSVVDGLFSVLMTLRQVPVIRAQCGTAAEMIAERLEKRLRDNLRDPRNSMFSSVMGAGGSGSLLESGALASRPVLILADRNIDLATPLHHTWTYQALVHDVLQLNLNQVQIECDAPSGVGARKTHTKKFDLSVTDDFWQNQRGSPFPVVAEAVQSELDKYRSRESELKSLKDGFNDEDASSSLSTTTNKITSAVESLPELLARKQLLDLHTTVATGLLDCIKARHLDEYFEIEERILSHQSVSSGAQERSILELINDAESGKPEDKLRLFLILLLSGPVMSDSEIDQYLLALQNIGCTDNDLSAVKFIRQWKSITSMSSNSPTVVSGGGGTTTRSMFSKLMQHGSSFLMEGVKNLVIKRTNLPITQITEALMEHRNISNAKEFRYFDPKLPQKLSSSNEMAAIEAAKNRVPFQDAIVFVVGGGNYIEYQNLIDWQRVKSGMSLGGAMSTSMGNSSTSRRNVIYGSTDLVNAEEFLQQLQRLGSGNN